MGNLTPEQIREILAKNGNTTKYASEEGSPQKGNNEIINANAKDKDGINQLKKREVPENYTLKEQLLEELVKQLNSINPELANKVKSVLANPEIDKQINFIEKGPSTGKTTIEGYKVKTEINITKNKSGLVACAQELIAAGVTYDYIHQQKIHDEQKLKFIKEMSSKFCGLIYVNYLAKNGALNENESYSMIQGLLQEDKHINTEGMEHEQTERLFNQTLDENPEIFNNQHDYSAQSFGENFNRVLNKNTDYLNKENMQNFALEQAENGNAMKYIANPTTLGKIAALNLTNRFHSSPADTQTKIVECLVHGTMYLSGNNLVNKDGTTICELTEEEKNKGINEYKNEIDRNLIKSEDKENVLVLEKKKNN